tara:strand:+ start:167 stop:412 length:246 start_codon:yes stop_codon:yes gene_type:complete
MKDYKNNFFGKKTKNKDETYTVELLESDEVKHTHTVPDEAMADAMIIPWVVQEGYTLEEKTSETDPVDVKDSKFAEDFIKE